MRVQQILHMLENYNPPLISEKEFHLSVFLEKMRGALKTFGNCYCQTGNDFTWLRSCISISSWPLLLLTPCNSWCIWRRMKMGCLQKHYILFNITCSEKLMAQLPTRGSQPKEAETKIPS
ncbi:hypothetical protein Y1Q_0003671 [Alligator mississippiensis]|uniref:Uncharacterized protein n=1 Tax=Alligator mississippiensis TaxID=8496 RepID=A0A151MSM7_ALLMI|nr:hypothetical protein Y1Q_0003671 [Alligator mississippiensis]